MFFQAFGYTVFVAGWLLILTALVVATVSISLAMNRVVRRS